MALMEEFKLEPGFDVLGFPLSGPLNVALPTLRLGGKHPVKGTDG